MKRPEINLKCLRDRKKANVAMNLGNEGGGTVKT